jgi:hypothetical protein
MNGAKAIGETLAKRRLYFSSLPGMAELLPVRESKKERLAYLSQLDEEIEHEPAPFAPDGVNDVDDPFEGIA